MDAVADVRCLVVSFAFPEEAVAPAAHRHCECEISASTWCIRSCIHIVRKYCTGTCHRWRVKAISVRKRARLEVRRTVCGKPFVLQSIATRATSRDENSDIPYLSVSLDLQSLISAREAYIFVSFADTARTPPATSVALAAHHRPWGSASVSAHLSRRSSSRRAWQWEVRLVRGGSCG